MYAAYLYIFRAFDSAAATRLAKSPDPEREIADGRWPSAAVRKRSSAGGIGPHSRDSRLRRLRTHRVRKRWRVDSE